ncbi:MAG: hypothetical protein AAGJ94_02410 [Pseudomonadota bacterium]
MVERFTAVVGVCAVCLLGLTAVPAFGQSVVITGDTAARAPRGDGERAIIADVMPADTATRPAGTVPLASRPPASRSVIGSQGAGAERRSPSARQLVESQVSDVRVTEGYTVATLNRASQSQCPSNFYIYERQRPKWAAQTGRLMQAMRDGVSVRVSFTCRDGAQSINALQFLSVLDPTSTLGAGSAATAASRAAAQNRLEGPIPLPSGNTTQLSERDDILSQLPKPAGVRLNR